MESALPIFKSETEWRGACPVYRHLDPPRLPIAQFCRDAQISVQSVWLWENGKKEPSPGSFALLERYFQIPMETLQAEWREWLAAKPPQN